MAEKKCPGAQTGATGAGSAFQAMAGNTSQLSENAANAKGAGLYHVTPEGGETFTITARGRAAWALDRLRCAGLKGCTPITEPAPRWSAYVHRLRALGVPIETVREPHGGAYAGTHGRYVLRARVQKGGAA
jgi:hypothetical protein